MKPVKNELYDVYFRKLTSDGDFQLNPAGRFAIIDGEIIHISDYYKFLERLIPEGTPDEFIAHRLSTLFNSPYLQIKCLIHKNDTLDSIPELELLPPSAEPQIRPGVFEYHRVGMEKPHIVETNGNLILLDGKLLRPEEVVTLLDNVQRGVATIRYHQTPDLTKMEEAFDGFVELKKTPEDPGEDYWGQMASTTAKQQSEKGKKVAAWLRTLDPEMRKKVSEFFLVDHLIPGVGSAAAYHFEKPAFENKGYHVSIDANDFGIINKRYGGQNVGDTAISAIGLILRQAADKAGIKRRRLYRKGGDEFHAHFDSHDKALHFMREVRERMKATPILSSKTEKNPFKLSVSMGLGTNPISADEALVNAKKFKLTMPTDPASSRRFSPGQIPTLIHSLVPGNEGQLPEEEKWTAPSKAVERHKNVVSVVQPGQQPPSGQQKP